jgi:hypothetical protein
MLLFLRVTPNQFGVNHAEQRAVDARIPAPLLGLDLAANTANTIARRSRQAGFGEPTGPPPIIRTGTSMILPFVW